MTMRVERFWALCSIFLWPQSVTLKSQPAPFAPSQFPSCLSQSHLTPISSPHVSACPICLSCLSLSHLTPVSSPHILACLQSAPLTSWPAPFTRPPVALSACPMFMSKSLYFVRPEDTFVVIIGRESYFIHLFCGEIVLTTSNDIHRPQHFFS